MAMVPDRTEFYQVVWELTVTIVTVQQDLLSQAYETNVSQSTNLAYRGQ